MDPIVNGVPLLAVVLGLVELTKKLGLKGNILIGVSVVIGLLLGGGYQLSLAWPADFAGWFFIGLYGLAMGLAASGLYDLGHGLVKSLAKSMAR